RRPGPRPGFLRVRAGAHGSSLVVAPPLPGMIPIERTFYLFRSRHGIGAVPRTTAPARGRRRTAPGSGDMDGFVTVRERLSATIEPTVPSQDGRLRTPGDSKGRRHHRRLPGVPGVIVSGRQGRSGVVFMAVVLRTRP